MSDTLPDIREELLSALNPQQREAVITNDCPLVVFAGAGSGKTRVITTKIAWCVRVLGIRPWQILAVTFTNKACKEMQQRVERMLPDCDPKDFCIKTFHSFGAMVLRRFGDRLGLNNNFKIYDEEDSLALLAQVFPGEKKTDLKPISGRISVCKDRLESPEDVRDSRDPEFYRYYSGYQSALQNTGNVDFADLIGRTTELLDRDPEVLSWCHNRFKVILVDEYQDSNLAQCRLLKRVVGPDAFVCVVGDDDQSIYRFRGAEVRNILDFGEYFPGARVIKLEQNYRSTAPILDVAAAVIGKNTGRAPKRLWTQRGGGSRPELISVDSDYAEATYVARILERDGRYDSSAVLYRNNSQSATFETIFNRLRIPYRLVGALRFYEREEVKDLIAHLSLLINPRDSVSFGRIINKPPRKIGPTTLQKITDSCGQYNGDMILTCRAVAEGRLPMPPQVTSALSVFVSAYDKAAAMIGLYENSEVLKAIITGFGVGAWYAERDRKEQNIDSKRVKNIEQTVNIFAEQEAYRDGIDGINAFMEEAALDPTMMAAETGTDDRGVTLITMHNTKGLEFDRVFVVGLEEGIIPSIKSESPDDIEEERRLLYVAITRAKNELYLFNCSQRNLWGRMQNQIPSRFLKDIPDSLVTRKGSSIRDSLFTRSSSRDDSDTWGSDYDYNPYQSRPVYKPAPYTSTKPGPASQVKSSLLSRKSGPTSPSAPSASPTQAPSEFRRGERVRHSAYGSGTVTAIKTLGSRSIIDVRFDDGRRASFVSGKAPLEKL